MDKDNHKDKDKDQDNHTNEDKQDVEEDHDWNEIAIMEEEETPLEHLPFTQQPGPMINLDSESEPHEYYQLFVDDALLLMLVDGTKEYARSRIYEMSKTGYSKRSQDGGARRKPH